MYSRRKYSLVNPTRLCRVLYDVRGSMDYNTRDKFAITILFTSAFTRILSCILQKFEPYVVRELCRATGFQCFVCGFEDTSCRHILPKLSELYIA